TKKKMYHFIIPKQPIYTTCLYVKYNTNFTSLFYKIKATTFSSSVSSLIDISLTILHKHFNSITDELLASSNSKLQLSQLFRLPQFSSILILIKILFQLPHKLNILIFV